jgi:predicted permease
MLQDYRLGLRMLLKYPGLTLAGGLALALAIGIGAGWHDISGKLMSPTIPLPEGDRIVRIETQNILTSAAESRVLHDFLGWRRELKTLEGLAAYRTDTRNLIVGDAKERRQGVPVDSAPALVQVAEITADAFATARVPPLLGRALVEDDEKPGASRVVVLGYDLWQRHLAGRQDVVGTVVQLGSAMATVAGVMPTGFAFPYSHNVWTPLPLRASYEPLEGGAVTVVGRLAPGVSREQANAELRVMAERMAAARPATHEHLRSAVWRLGESSDAIGAGRFAIRNVPALLVLAIACLSVGTLVYARTATREGEIAVRSAIGASRARIVSQLFVETLVLASIAAALGLAAADRFIREIMAREAARGAATIGDAPFWFTPGLRPSTILYAAGLAVVGAAMLSVLPALRATRARVQPHLANAGSHGATLRFGRVWTGAMIVQIALTAIGIPVAMDVGRDVIRTLNIRAAFPSRNYVAVRIDMDRRFDEESAPVLEERRAQAAAELMRRLAEEPAVAAVAFADRSLGVETSMRSGHVEPGPGANPVYDRFFRLLAVGPGFFETFERPIVAGRDFNGGDWNPAARTVIVNEAFARGFSREAGGGSPVGARLRYRGARVIDDGILGEMVADDEFEIVGIVRDFGLDPDGEGDETPCVFHTASAGTVSPLVISARVRGNPDSLAARLPVIAADIDPRLVVRSARPLDMVVRENDVSATRLAGTMATVTSLILFLSALGIFSLVSVSVSRRTREIGLRVALGANPRQVLAGILWRAGVVLGSGLAGGGAILLWFNVLTAGPSSGLAEDVTRFLTYFGITSAIMIAACAMACFAPARRALRISPTDALREA